MLVSQISILHHETEKWETHHLTIKSDKHCVRVSSEEFDVSLFKSNDNANANASNHRNALVSLRTYRRAAGLPLNSPTS